MSDWLDRLAADLVHVEGELRAALLSIRRGRAQHPRTRMAGVVPGITISPGEARTLIRGAMPAPIAGTRLRQPHARMVAALQVFGQHLLALNNPLHPRAAAVAAAHDLQDALAAWQSAASWMEASRRARVRWPVPISAVTGPGTRRPAAQKWNIDLPNAAMGRLHHPAAALRSLRRQPEPEIRDAETADLRQLALPLHIARAA